MSRKNSFKSKSDRKAPRRDRPQRITSTQKQRDWGLIPASYRRGVAILDQAEESVLRDLQNYQPCVYEMDIGGVDPEIALLVFAAACDHHVALGGKAPTVVVLNQEEVES